MKNTLKIFVITFIFNIVFISNIFATTTFNVSSPTAKIGEEVLVDVSIADNTGFVGYQILLNYDISKLEYISSTNGDLVNSKLAILGDDISKGIIKQACVNQDSITGNGSLMKVTFKVKDEVNKENIPITLKVQKLINDVGEDNIKNVEYTVLNGNIILDNKKNDITTITNASKMINVIKENNGKAKLKLKDENFSKKINYRSTDENKAIVDNEGNVTYLSSGDVKIEVLADDEVIDTVNLNITPDEVNNLQNFNEDNVGVEEEKQFPNKKYIIIITIIFLVVTLLIIGVIIYFNKRKRRNENEKK